VRDPRETKLAQLAHRGGDGDTQEVEPFGAAQTALMGSLFWDTRTNS
jgi:hypothetical protein